MDKSQIRLTFENVRAIDKAEIVLNGITVITGENGCGKSTISKLTYNLIKTTTEFDEIVDRKLKEDIFEDYGSLLRRITFELQYLFSKEEYVETRNAVSKNIRDGAQLAEAIDFLVGKFKRFAGNDKKSEKNRNVGLNADREDMRIRRVKKILVNSLSETSDVGANPDIPSLLLKIKDKVFKLINESKKLKEKRPLNILEDSLISAFSDLPLPSSFNLYEYEVPIIDRKKKILTPIHSIQNVTYIDTPMIMGIDFFGERPHWDDMNALLSRKPAHSYQLYFEKLFNDVFKGDVKIDDEEILGDSFVYKRNDSKEFDLLECATGLKSFSILRLLLKNGFLNEKTLLIIDEPEAHLHPQWVVEYARLVVLLNKKLGVRFLIASHHPDMISAIKYIAKKEKVSSTLNFYLAEKKEQDGFTYKYKHLGIDIEPIFASFNIAFERMDMYGTTE